MSNVYIAEIRTLGAMLRQAHDELRAETTHPRIQSGMDRCVELREQLRNAERTYAEAGFSAGSDRLTILRIQA